MKGAPEVVVPMCTKTIDSYGGLKNMDKKAQD